MPVTLKDIALLIGISRQAVAAALEGDGSSRVSEATRAKVIKLARELNYVPNLAARNLRGGNCLSNLKQLSSAFVTYATDNGDSTVLANPSGTAQQPSRSQTGQYGVYLHPRFSPKCADVFTGAGQKCMGIH